MKTENKYGGKNRIYYVQNNSYLKIIEMKKNLSYLFLAVLMFCSSSRSSKVENVNSQDKSPTNTETKSTIYVQSTNIGSESENNRFITQIDNGINCRFKADCSIAIGPTTKIDMNLLFEKANGNVKDVLNTQVFSKYMDLNNVKNIQIDSFVYNVRNEKIDLKFNVTLVREQNKNAKKLDKYTFKYFSDFENPKQKVQLVKAEKTSIECFDSYN